MVVDSKTETSLDKEIVNWQGYSSVLMKDNRIAFSKMMSDAKMSHAAFDKAPTKEPTETLFLTLIFQQQKMIEWLLSQIAILKISKRKRQQVELKGIKV